jgi:hypothetical protein
VDDLRRINETGITKQSICEMQLGVRGCGFLFFEENKVVVVEDE